MNLGGGGAFSAALAARCSRLRRRTAAGSVSAATPRKDNTKLMLVAIIGAGALVALAIVLGRRAEEGRPSRPRQPRPPRRRRHAAPAARDPQRRNRLRRPGRRERGSSAAALRHRPAPTAPSVGGGRRGSNKTQDGGGDGGGGGGGGGGSPRRVRRSPPAPRRKGGGGGGQQEPQQGSGLRTAPGGGAPAAQASAPFDRGAAAAALGSINVAGCKKSDGPTGSGHIRVTFSPSGNVISAVVDQPPFSGTAVGGCVAGKFRSAHIPPFGGARYRRQELHVE